MSAIDELVGTTLEGGWTLTELVPPGETGGNFSIGYRAKSEGGELAFVKLADVSKAARSPNSVAALLELLQAHQMEQDIAMSCSTRGLNRIVRAHAFGTIMPSDGSDNIPYIVFEHADGDIRKYMDLGPGPDLADRLRLCHDACTAVRQLHTADIAHQDVKPSNHLVFGDRSPRFRISKLGDLGRATRKHAAGLYDDAPVPGDSNYAAPELAYGEVHPSFEVRRFAADLYQLGNLCSFVLTGNPLHLRVRSYLDVRHNHQNMHGQFRDALPYLRHAHQAALEDIDAAIGNRVGHDATQLIQYLTDPDPELRGHPRERRGGNPYSLQRFVSRFDTLAHRAAIENPSV